MWIDVVVVFKNGNALSELTVLGLSISGFPTSFPSFLPSHRYLFMKSNVVSP